MALSALTTIAEPTAQSSIGNTSHVRAGREVSTDQIEQLRRADVTMWARLNPDILLWAERLRAAGYKTAILSNMHDDMVQHLR